MADDRLAEFITDSLMAALEVAPPSDHIGSILYESDVTIARRGTQTLRVDVKISGYPVRPFVVQVFEE